MAWTCNMFNVVATTTTILLLCLICELDARKVYIYDPPGTESEIYAQSDLEDFRILPVRSVSQQQVRSPAEQQDQPAGFADAIRIIDPPKYVPTHHHQKPDEDYGRIREQSPNYQNPFGRGSTFKAPPYLPLPNKLTSPEPRPTTLQTNYREHLGLQHSTPEIIRGQIGGLKERQKIYFPAENTDRPVRTKYRVKPVVEDQPIYGQSAYKPNRQNYRAGQDEYVVGNTFVVADNSGVSHAQTAPKPVTPYKHLASVRHEDNIRHVPREGLNPRIKERLRTQKTHTVYAEQGYNDKNFQNGDQQRYRTQYTKHRSKRATNNNNNNYILSRHVDRVEELPIALSLVNDDGKKLVGQDLLKHIANLIQDSKQLVPKEAKNDSAGEEMASILVPSKGFQELYEKSMKVIAEAPSPPNHQPNTPIYLSASPHPPRAERLQGSPYSPYQRTKAVNCDYNFDPQENGKKKRPGQQIECLKEKYFSKEPLADKFYDDQPAQYVNHPSGQGKNPSFQVYDDVMQTIESSRIKPAPKYEGSQFGLDLNPETAQFSEASLPIFDITKYFPQVYMIKPSGKVYGIKFKQNVNSNSNNYNDEYSEPKKQVEVTKKPPKKVQYEPATEERDRPYDVRTFEEPVSDNEEQEYVPKYRKEQKFAKPRPQTQVIEEQVEQEEATYDKQQPPIPRHRLQQHPQHPPQQRPEHVHRQQQQEYRQQQQHHHQQQQPQQQHHHQQQQQPQQNYQRPHHPQGHHQQNHQNHQQRYTHQGPPSPQSNHYQVQRQFVQQHSPKPQQHRRPEAINYNGFGPKPVQNGHPSHPSHVSPHSVHLPIAHILKFVPEDAIRPHQQRI